MGRTVRQKRKNRSGRAKVKQTNKPKKQLNPLGNRIIAQNWDKNETLTQNYRRLGLLTRLQAPTGGSEPTLVARDGAASLSRHVEGKSAATAFAPLKINAKTIAPGALREVTVERDADGRIVRVLRDQGRNPLNDPLNELESSSDDDDDQKDDEEEFQGWDAVEDPDFDDDEKRDGAGGSRRVVDELERMARRPVLKEVRAQSSREVEWLERLVRKHGDDTAAMARDHKLNPMQQTAADIARRIKKMKSGP